VSWRPLRPRRDVARLAQRIGKLSDLDSTWPLVLRLEGVHVKLGAHHVLRGVDLSVAPGERVALMGPNGAGKTTLLRVAAGLLRPDRGRTLVAGQAADQAAARARLGWASASDGLDARLSARDVLSLWARAYAAGSERVSERAAIAARVDAAAAAFAIVEHLDAPAGTLSLGLQRRVILARASLAGAGGLLLFDEALAGLDAAASEVAWRALAGRTLLLATHDAAVAAQCDRTVRLNEGLLAAEGV